MSQAGAINTSSSPVPPTVATSYVTDVNSPAIPAANILNVLGNDTTADNDNGIRTDGSSGSNTLTIQLTNRLFGTASVTGAITGNVITFALSASAAVYRFSIIVTGRDTTSGDGVGYTINGSARTNGAAATIISTADIDADEDASLSAALMSFVASGNNVIVQPTGVAGRTITYKAVGTYEVV